MEIPQRGIILALDVPDAGPSPIPESIAWVHRHLILIAAESRGKKGLAILNEAIVGGAACAGEAVERNEVDVRCDSNGDSRIRRRRERC